MHVLRRAVSLSASLAVMPACSGSQPPIGAPGAVQQSRAIEQHAARVDHKGSWMLPEASNEDLLYVTNYSDVTVYTYPGNKLVGTLHGFYSAVGECVDAKGNVFVTNSKPDAIYEYAHGGLKRIATLSTKDVGPVGCAIDPTTGNLAVTGSGSHERINVFKKARGKPTLYKASQFFDMSFCGYDNEGNLFVNGSNLSRKAALAELPKGSKTLLDVRLDSKIASDGGVQWDGQYLTVGGYRHPKSYKAKPVIYRFLITGQSGTTQSTVSLGSPAHIVLQYYIQNDTVVVPNWFYVDSEQRFNVLFYGYPAGGAPTAALTKHVSNPRGVVVSLHPKPLNEPPGLPSFRNLLDLASHAHLPAINRRPNVSYNLWRCIQRDRRYRCSKHRWSTVNNPGY
jgi:hypothetical protein